MSLVSKLTFAVQGDYKSRMESNKKQTTYHSSCDILRKATVQRSNELGIRLNFAAFHLQRRRFQMTKRKLSISITYWSIYNYQLTKHK